MGVAFRVESDCRIFSRRRSRVSCFLAESNDWTCSRFSELLQPEVSSLQPHQWQTLICLVTGTVIVFQTVFGTVIRFP